MVCNFFTMTANLTVPAIMTRSKISCYFTKDKAKANKLNRRCMFLGMPEGILNEIKENIVLREDLMEVGM